MSLRHRMGIFLKEYVERRAERAIKSHPVLKKYLEDYALVSSSTGCEYADYLALYNWVCDHKPREVLECGTGFSTVVLAQALKENEEKYGISGHLVSMEENKKYYDMALRSFPSDLKDDPRFEIIFSPAVEETYEFFRGVRYQEVPKRSYDFVFVDGPNFMTDPKRHPLTFNFDLVDIVRKSERPVSALIDTRTSTCFIYSLLFPEKFRYDYLRKIGIVYFATKNDLADARRIVAGAMKRHAFHRPTLRALLRGRY